MSTLLKASFTSQPAAFVKFLTHGLMVQHSLNEELGVSTSHVRHARSVYKPARVSGRRMSNIPHHSTDKA
jgi:hypothetical protein